MKSFVYFSPFLFFTFLSQALFAQESAEVIVQKMVTRDKELSSHRAAYTYTVDEIREKLDDDLKATSTEKTEVVIRADKSPDYQTRSGPAAQGLEGEAKKASQEEPFNILQIISHYQYAEVGQEMACGVLCHKIKFTPKEDQPFHNREEKVANQLAGYLWIAVADYSLVQNTGRLTKPVSVAWFLATLTDMEFLFETKTLPNGEPGPSRIQYRFRVSVPFMTIHERHTRLMTDYRLIN